jgi:hypothetical protein
MCGHQCDCYCHTVSHIGCVRCGCQKCYICEKHIFPNSLSDHIKHCHSEAEAHPAMMQSPPRALVNAIGIAA